MIGVCGEALVDLLPSSGDARLVALPGGSPVNVAIGLARLGCDVAYVGTLSHDTHGRLLRGHLAADQVRLDRATSVEAPTPVATAHIDGAGRATYDFALDGTTAQVPIDARALDGLDAVHISCGAVALDAPGLGVSLAALLERPGQRVVSFDPNVRPGVAHDRVRYAEHVDRAVRGATIVKVSDEDLDRLHPGVDPGEVARAWSRRGPALVVVTRGPAGCLAVSGATELTVPAPVVEVVDTVGAGDAFTAGMLAGLWRHGALSRFHGLDRHQLDDVLRSASAAAALTCTRRGADPPTTAELSTGGR